MKFSSFILAAVSACTVSGATLPNFWEQLPLSGPGSGARVPGESPLMYCGSTEGDILIIDHVDIDPNPPVQGEKLVIKASGELKEKIEAGAYVKLTVKLGYIKLVSQTIDLCDHASEIDLECPVEKGQREVTKEVEIPKAIPPGKYNVQADVYTKDDEPITCICADIIFYPK